MEMDFLNSNVTDFLKFQNGSIIGAIEDGILLDDRTGWIHEVTCEIIMTWLGMNEHHDGYWVGFSNTRVLLERKGYRKVLVKPQRYNSMIDGNQ
jgi:hypothetical protein